MTMPQIREKARLLGVKNYSRLRKADLIRAIQAKEGNSPCYQTIPGCQEQDCGSRVALVRQSNNTQSLEARAPLSLNLGHL